MKPSRLDRQSALWTRRRWCSAVGATALSALISPVRRLAGEDAVLDISCRGEPGNPVRRRACEWLWAQQGRDGGWHSEHYAPLRGGRALSPLVFDALQRADENGAPCGTACAHAADFLRTGVSESGAVGADDPELLEYPTYATALTLQALVQHSPRGDARPIERMRSWLVAQQYCESTGCGPAHPCYGGWGFGAARPLGGAAGHVDLAHTRRVLQALRAAGHDDATTYARAERFLSLLQKWPRDDRPQPSSARVARSASWQAPCDGGFYFSPTVYAANKGGERIADGQPYFVSYATATCEGALALLACGVPRDDERLVAATRWLEAHPQLELPAGATNSGDTRWAESIRFDHFAVRGECYAALGWPGAWRDELYALLAERQHSDGSFVNSEGFLMKEDDPLLGTTLALIALNS